MAAAVTLDAQTALVRTLVNVRVGFLEMEDIAAMLTNALLVLTAVTSKRNVQIQSVRFNVLVTMAIQEMEHNALKLMNAWQILTTVIHIQTVQILPGHFSVNALEGLLEMEQPVKTSMNAFKRSIVTQTRIVQIRRDHLTVHAIQALQGMAEAAMVNVMYNNFGFAHTLFWKKKKDLTVFDDLFLQMSTHLWFRHLGSVMFGQ